jgi:hypothetical protein
MAINRCVSNGERRAFLLLVNWRQWVNWVNNAEWWIQPVPPFRLYTLQEAYEIAADGVPRGTSAE